ncbi:MAG: hypothetical protein ACE5HO_18540 [bacterium]
MTDGVKVWVNNINAHEINQLNTLFATLPTSYNHTDLTPALRGDHYVVTVDAQTSAEIKKVLSAILSVIEPERITLEP